MMGFIRKYYQEFIVVSVFLIAAFGFNVYRVQSDGLQYYAFLEKMLHIPQPESSAAALEGAFFFQAGCAFFYAPFYLAAYAIERLLGVYPDFNGITLRQIAINLAANVYMVCSLLLTARILRRLNLRWIVTSVLCVLFSTTAFASAVIIPSFNHAVDIFINTLLFYFVIGFDRKRPVYLYAAGFVYVISVLVRYANFITIFPIAAYILLGDVFLREGKIKSGAVFCIGKCGVSDFGRLCAGILATCWIVPLVFWVYNGDAFAYLGVHGETATFLERRPALPVYVLKYLLHPLHGLFVWSPVVMLSVVGLGGMPKRYRLLGICLIGVCACSVVLYGYVYAWHGGWSFSNRYLVHLFPVYAIGLSACIGKSPRFVAAIACVLTVYSIFLFFNWYLGVVHGEFGTVWDVLQSWISGKSVTFEGCDVNARNFFARVWEICRYKYLMKFL